MKFHESFSREETVEGSSDRAFGLVFATAAALLAGIRWYRGHGMVRELIIIACVFLALALLLPRVLRPLNRAWTAFGLLLHKITNPVVMGLIFFVVLTPMALVMRALGKDPMRRKWDPEASTYWLTRDRERAALSTMRDQF